ncbi:MAG: hypothetical protein LBG52_00115 [Candidatus Peribacteria bacterium]|jgi:hypothetical protein|nr:hypothetical protein [Candidatus Peribacteria bacterium]
MIVVWFILVLVAGSANLGMFAMQLPTAKMENTQSASVIAIKLSDLKNSNTHSDSASKLPLKLLTPLEKELHDLGCIQWADVGEITSGILSIVKAFHNPERGCFILKPGLTLFYLDHR